MAEIINVSAVPGETPLKDASGLIPKHVRTQSGLNLAEYQNINKVLPKYFLKKVSDKKAPFTAAWLCKLHEEMFGEVWEWAGKKRETELSIGVRAHKIAGELHRLQVEICRWEESEDPPIGIAAKIHHRLVWIHPFYGGNGRWARMAADIYLRKKDLAPVAWPDDPALVGSSFRKKYIQALKSADDGDFSKIIDLHKLHNSKEQP